MWKLAVAILAALFLADSAGAYEAPTYTAGFKWAQSNKTIRILVLLSDFSRDGVVRYSKEGHVFVEGYARQWRKGPATAGTYKLDLQLYKSINVEASRYFRTGDGIELVIAKEMPGEWKRLLRSKNKPPNMKVWWEVMSSGLSEGEDDEDDDDDDDEGPVNAAHNNAMKKGGYEKVGKSFKAQGTTITEVRDKDGDQSANAIPDTRLPAFDKYAKLFVLAKNAEEKRAVVEEAVGAVKSMPAKSNETDAAKYYTTVMRRALDQGMEFFGNEEERLDRIIGSKGITEEKRLLFKQRMVILTSFLNWL